MRGDRLWPSTRVGPGRGHAPIRNRCASLHREADLTYVAINQAPQRCRRVGVRGTDAGVQRLLRRLAVKGNVGRPAQQRDRVIEERDLARIGAAQAGEHVTGCSSCGPGNSQGRRDPAQFVDRLAIGWRNRAQDSEAAAQHQLGGGHPRHQRDFGVVRLHR